jgi:hypothetical protein
LPSEISTSNVRPKTAKKLVSANTINALSNLMDTLEEGPKEPEYEEPAYDSGFQRNSFQVLYEPGKPSEGGSRNINLVLKEREKVSFEKRLEKVKKGMNKEMTGLQENADKSLKDNRGETRVQMILSIALFVAGVIVLSIGLLQNHLEIVATSAIPGILIVYPYNNLTKIRRENTFLCLFVSWIKTGLLSCELNEKPKDVIDCYKKGLGNLSIWMKQLQEKAYGSEKTPPA